jgi:hypothetical protein
MGKQRILTTGDAEALKSVLEEKYDGNASVIQAGETIMATIEHDGWRHHDEGMLSDLYEQGKIGPWWRFWEQ